MKHGGLRIYKSNEVPDYQKSGYWWNQRLGSNIAKDTSLIPFYYAFATAGSGTTITSFTLEQIDRFGNACLTYALTSTWLSTQSNDEHKIFLYDGGQDILGSLSSYNDGMYRYKIVTNIGKTYYSEPFIIDSYKYISVIGVGDFEHDDFDPADFY